MRLTRCFVVILAVWGALSVGVAWGDYLKMNPPPDVDKPGNVGQDNTCWMATASNMLAGAGYGNGATVQARADNIYGQMVAHYGRLNCGWPDAALQWWLNSANNLWPANPYKVITVLGNKNMTPWLNPNAPKDIGNQLRSCQMVGTCLYNYNIHHAITVWGDNGAGAGQLANNPSQIKVTDSDRDTGGNVQTYTWDPYNAASGWTYNFANPHTTLENIVTLCPTVNHTTNQTNVQKASASYRIHQDNLTAATDLHYKVWTDVNVLTYNTTIDWATTYSPTITEYSEPNPGHGAPYDTRHGINVTWNFSTPVPYCNWITINTEFVEPSWNFLTYQDVYFTYPGGGKIYKTSIGWDVQTPVLSDPNVPNVSGGYVVGAYDVYSDFQGTQLVGQYRFSHQYGSDQNPESHLVTLTLPPESTGVVYVGNLRFGQSYGYLSSGGQSSDLWSFNDWMTYDSAIRPLTSTYPLMENLDWTGLLPYPSAPGPNLPSIAGDLNGDGLVNAADIDMEFGAIRSGVYNSFFDLTGDGLLDHGDADFLVQGILGTQYGDANLSRTVDADDYVVWFNNIGNTQAGWSQGDCNGSMTVDADDYVLWFNSIGFSSGGGGGVPEPVTLSLLAAGGILAVLRRRR